MGLAQAFIFAMRAVGLVAGPGVGGTLYQEGCWALPFGVGAAWFVLVTIVVTIGLGCSQPPSFRTTKQQLTGCQLMQMCDVWMVVIPLFLVCMVTSFLEPCWQGFLGREPFDKNPQDIGIFLNKTIAVYMLVLFLGGVFVHRIGAALQYAVGGLMAGVGLLFIGPSPLLQAEGFGQTEDINLMGAMITFSGVALAMPACLPLVLEVYSRAGYSQKQVATATSAMFIFVICLGNTLGPPISGMLDRTKEKSSLPSTATLYSVVMIASILPLCFVLVCKYGKCPCSPRTPLQFSSDPAPSSS